MQNQSEEVKSTQGLDPAESKLGIVDSELDSAVVNDEFIEIASQLFSSDGIRGQADRAVALALTQKGMREEPCGTNKNAYSRYFGYGPQFWCADFVSWAFDQTGNRDRKVPWGYPSNVSNITNWGRAHGLLVRSPARGDIFTLRNGTHVGLVVSSSNDQFTTIEGNTSGPDGKPCWVYNHNRRNDGTYFFIRWPS